MTYYTSPEKRDAFITKVIGIVLLAALLGYCAFSEASADRIEARFLELKKERERQEQEAKYREWIEVKVPHGC